MAPFSRGYEPVIGLEVHAELLTRSKMFCACPVVDPTQAAPNTAVCPVCSGMPGTLPTVNQQAVELGLRVALALQCTISTTSLFARKNYFYPDLPKGYQISQYEYPLAEGGQILVPTAESECLVRIRRVHLEEDTGKLTHYAEGEASYSLVDLNRAGIPLLEIVSEPDLHSPEEARAYASTLRNLLRALGVNSGDMEKGAIRFEVNVSVRPRGSKVLGTRVEIKNLNSFRALERAVAFEIERQSQLVDSGGQVVQETLGWDEALERTLTQRTKEEAHDYRYFPEPDLPPLVIDAAWVERVRMGLPELPQEKVARWIEQFQIEGNQAVLLAGEASVAVFFEEAASAAARQGISPRLVANWIQGELFGLVRPGGEGFESLQVTPSGLVELLDLLGQGAVNPATAKVVLAEMAASGQTAGEVIAARGFYQVSDLEEISRLVGSVLSEHPQEVEIYLAGKKTLEHWFFGQVMRLAGGQANPQVVRAELERQLGIRQEKS